MVMFAQLQGDPGLGHLVAEIKRMRRVLDLELIKDLERILATPVSIAIHGVNLATLGEDPEIRVADRICQGVQGLLAVLEDITVP